MFVEQPSIAKSSTTAATTKTLVALRDDLSTLRNAVGFTTRPGDPARATLRFETPLRATTSLVELAPEIIAGARSLQGRFPALTDAVIADAERALHAATVAVEASRKGKVVSSFTRIDSADARQLALDVLLDCIDHLRAAARTTLHKTRPKLCEALCAPIEPQRTRAAAVDTDAPVDDAAKPR